MSGFVPLSARMVGLAAVFGASMLVVPVAGPAMAAPAPNHVGIVVGGAYACVSWHAGITGDEVLNDVASVHYRTSDHLIDQINGVPNPPHADVTHYWSYWHDTNGSWVYSNAGASGSSPAAGTVDGWSYTDDQADAVPPAAGPGGLYAQLCGAQDGPAPEPTHSSRSSAPHRSARPPVHAGSARSSSAVIRSSTAGSATRTKGAHAPASSASVRRSSRAASATRSDSGGPVGLAALDPGAATSASSKLTRLAAKPKSSDGGGSSVPMLIGLGLVALLGGAAAWAARRRGAG